MKTVKTMISAIVVGLFIIMAYGSMDDSSYKLSEFEDSLKIKLTDTLQHYINKKIITADYYNQVTSTFIDTALVDTSDIQAINYYEFILSELETKEKAKQEDLEKNKKKLKQLISQKFNVTYDEFSKIETYKPKVYGKYLPRTKTLLARVNSTGYIALSSNYFASNWLNYEQIQVLIGENKLTSHKVSRLSDDYITEIGNDGNIWENVTFKEDKIILTAIANNVDKTIKVRFVGQQYVDDITLSQKYKQAIADCYELANLIDLTN